MQFFSALSSLSFPFLFRADSFHFRRRLVSSISMTAMTSGAFAGAAVQRRVRRANASASSSAASATAARRGGRGREALQCDALVKLRFARYGRIHSPFYRVVAIESKKRQRGRPAEFLGWYNPMTKETQLDAPNIRKWLDRTLLSIHTFIELPLCFLCAASASRATPRRFLVYVCV